MNGVLVRDQEGRTAHFYESNGQLTYRCARALYKWAEQDISIMVWRRNGFCKVGILVVGGQVRILKFAPQNYARLHAFFSSLEYNCLSTLGNEP